MKELTTESVRPDEQDVPVGDEDAGIVAYLQYRGRHTSVTNDDLGLRFQAELTANGWRHDALPVVDPELAIDPPSNAVRVDVAEELVGLENNRLYAFGVACEADDCDYVGATPRKTNSHQSKHSDDDSDPDDGDDADVGTEEDT